MGPQSVSPYCQSLLSDSNSRSARIQTRTVGNLAVLVPTILLLCSRIALAQVVYADQAHADQSYDQPQANYALNTQQPLNAGQLEQLVAPIALYPDALVAQVLAAATYPQQVTDADRWRQEHSDASADQIAYVADGQPWDPSVKALTAFPQVLAQMDRNLQWTSDLGNAYYNQPQDVLEAIQVMRRRAQAAGTLRSTPQEVVRYDAGDMQLVPADPQVVYVPTYNPWAVYGDPVTPYSGFSLLGAIGDAFGSILNYGPGIAMSAFAHTPWGWLSWGLDWLGHALLFNDSPYYSNSATVADWGFPHRGFYAYSGRGGWERGLHNSAWGHEAWRRGGWGNESWRPARYDAGGWHSFRGGNARYAEDRRSFPSHNGFESFHGERGLAARLDNRSLSSNRSFSRSSENRRLSNGGEFRSAPKEGRTRGSERTFANNFSHSDFGARSSYFSSHSSAHSSAKSHGGGPHLFGGGHSSKGFDVKRSGFHSSGRSYASRKGFGGGKDFGRKSFGGGHSHGGGHSGGHSSGGKHHR